MMMSLLDEEPSDVRAAMTILAACLGAVVGGWLLQSSLHITDWTQAQASRVAVFPSAQSLVLAAALGLFAAAFLIRAPGADKRIRVRRARVVAPGAALWILAVPYTPWLSGQFPILTVLAGPVRWVVFGAVVLAVSVRLLGALNVRLWWRPPAPTLVFAVSFLLYAVCGLRSYEAVGITGDEPHYLIIAQSLLSDGDLRISNNHARRDYREFYAGELRPDSIRRGLDGDVYPNKAPGLPALLLPGYSIAGALGAIVTLALLGALAALAVFDAASRIGGPRVAAVVWVGTCLTVPFVPHAWSVFPEIAAAAIVAWAVVWLLDGLPIPAWRWAARGASLAMLPWLHTRFAVLFGALAVCVALTRRTRPREVIAFAVPVVLSFAAWFGFFYVIYGTFDPRAPWGGGANPNIKLANVPRGLVGLLFDQKFGLVVHTPFFVTAFAGAVWLLKDASTRLLAMMLVATFAAYVVSCTQMYTWWGGTSAPSRFLVGVLPLLVPFLAVFVSQASSAPARAFLWVTLCSSILVAGAGILLVDRRLLFSDPHGTSDLMGLIQGPAPLRWLLPTFTEQEWPIPRGSFPAWLAAAAVAVSALVFAGRRRNATVFSTGTVACLAFLLVGSFLVPLPDVNVRAETSLRGRLGLLDRFDPQKRWALDYRTFERIPSDSWLDAATVVLDRQRGHSTDRTGRFGPPLSLPPGKYEASVWAAGSRTISGDLQVTLGRDQILARQPAPISANPATLGFELPVTVPFLWIQLTDASTARDVVRAVIRPLAVMPSSHRPDMDIRAVETISGDLGSFVVYVSGGVYPERGGTFWTEGRRRARVMVRAATARQLVLNLHTGPVVQDVMVWIGTDQRRLRIQPPEHQLLVVDLPAADGGWLPIEVQASESFRPGDVDPASFDFRTLGCHVRLELR